MTTKKATGKTVAQSSIAEAKKPLRITTFDKPPAKAVAAVKTLKVDVAKVKKDVTAVAKTVATAAKKAETTKPVGKAMTKAVHSPVKKPIESDSKSASKIAELDSAYKALFQPPAG